MSEELKQKSLTQNGIKIGNRFEWYNIGNTTFLELAKAKIIPNKNYGDYNKKRPDGLIVDRSDKKNPVVIAVVEYKKKFNNEKEVLEATQQCNDYAQELGAKIGIITDTSLFYWINPKQLNAENNYEDDYKNIRSFSYIKDEQKQNLNSSFDFHNQKDHQENIEKLDDNIQDNLSIIDRILDTISKNNSNLQDSIYVDPTSLATSVWQDIYVATGKEPEKCLYNVVELFIFKFLSDLGVLERKYSFQYLIDDIEAGESEEEILKHYAITIRPKIRELFPSDIEDGTTIINGTIFVNEKGAPVVENAYLFKKSLVKYFDFGDLTKVKKEFKTKLYETFLKRDSGVKGMGQFFTPRKVVEAIIDMAKVEKTLKNGDKVCDPFCGVGGFPLEVMAKRKIKDFEKKGSEITPKIQYYGYDKGSSEKDSERTIILAKANMLIYLSELVRKNPKMTKEFSKIFNNTFSLKKGTLGTLQDISLDEDSKYDLILTNPPYVTSGSSILKEEIKKDSLKESFYQVNGNGVEGLSMEWIIRKLKKGGRAFVIIPKGIFDRLNDVKLRKFILSECHINGVISLPINTFYMTPQKTYILAITRKNDKNEKQKSPVFTYLSTDIGESLDVYRFDTGTSDLRKAVDLYKMFQGNEEADKEFFESVDEKCKIQPIDKFYNEVGNNWLIDNWWSKEEQINLGIQNKEEFLNLFQFSEKIKDTVGKVNIIENDLLTDLSDYKGTNKTINITLDEIIDIERGKSKYTQTYAKNNEGEHPLYSAKTTEKGLMGKINTFDYDIECLTYTTNGVKAGTLFFRDKHKFSLNGDSAIIFIKDKYKKELSYKFLYYSLYSKFKEYGFNWENKATPTKVGKINLDIPVNDNGDYDLESQIEIANKYEQVEKVKNNLIQELENLEKIKVEI